MLILARHSGESIVIGDDIELTVVEVQGDNVRLGISAPKSVTVLRKELLDEARSANEQAASTDIDLKSLESCLGPEEPDKTLLK